MRPLAVDSESFWREGFLVVRGVFSPEEAEEIRARAIRTEHKGDLLSNPLLRDVLLDDRMLRIAGDILGSTPVYFGDSSVMFGDVTLTWHKDCVDKNDPNGPDWQSRYNLIRIGLYLNDCHRKPGGVFVRKGSHNFLSVVAGDCVYSDTRMGDVIVWNLRTNHCGDDLLPRWFPRLFYDPYCLPLKLARRFSFLRFLARGPDRPRCAVFTTFGLDDPCTARFQKYLATRTYAVEAWKQSAYDDEVWRAVRDKPVVVRDMHGLLSRQGWPAHTNDGHVPIPY